MSFIKLYLNDIKDDYKKIIEREDISVILGSPGSGKTKLMEHISNEFDGLYLKVFDFIDIYEVDEIINMLKNKKLLCLDGFDEYRTSENSKSKALRVFAKKIKDLNKKIDIKVIISCRELDWYGDSDEATLKNYLNKDIEIFKILPLNEQQIDEFSDLKNIDNKQQFKEKFLDKGFLQTPQLFNIASTLQEENIANKIELFEKFILKAVNEENVEHQKLNLSNEDIFKYLGYLSFIFMFSDIKKFSDSVLRDIATDEYKINILGRLVKNGKIFSNETFIHRTIAEFLLGKYANYLIQDEGFNKKVILNKFKNRYAIYTELRGSFAWLCSISTDKTFIEVDPYYQLLYGENNHFSIEFKKDILHAIKNYSFKNPYFFRPDDYFAKDELKGFYTQKLDDFLQSEVLEAAKLKSHYLYIYDLILSSNKEIISQKMKQFLFKKIKENIFPEDFTVHILKYLKYSKEEYVELLNCIKNNEIKDENNRIKIEILNQIYPNNFSIDEMIEVLKEFKPTNFFNTCKFLYNTKDNDKIELVKKLEKDIMQGYRDEYYNNIDNYEKIQRYKCINDFLSHFYYELIHSYNGSNAKYLYDILKQTKKYYKHFQTFELKSYKSKIKKLSDDKLQELSNRLFKYYFLEKLENNNLENNNLENNNLEYFFIEHFKYFFPLKFPEVSKVLFEYFEENFSNLNAKLRDFLFKKIIQYNKDEDFDKALGDFAKKNNLKKNYEIAKQPLKIEETEELKKISEEIKEQENQVKRWRKSKEEYFMQIDKDIFFESLDDLKFISSILHMNENSQWKFTDKIKGFLKEFIFTDIYDKYIKIDNLLKNIENKQEFSFDKALFISLYLNDDYKNVLEKLSVEKVKYLYLLTLYNNIPLNTLTNKKFIAFANNEKFAKEALIDVFRYYQFYDILKDYLDTIEVGLLKIIVERSFYGQNKDKLIDSFLREFHLKLSNDTLNKLKAKCSTKLLEIVIKLKNQVLLTEYELVYLFKEVFDFRNNYRFFLELSFEDKVFLSFNFINIFNDGNKLRFVNGIQSNYQITASFVSTNLLKLLTRKEMEELLKKDISTYWKRVLNSEIYKKDSMEQNENQNILILKDFIKEKAFMNEYDFFNFIIDEINELKNRIEMNEDNEKNLFYDDGSHKQEEDCRDIFVNLLSKTSYVIIREEHIEKNRIDFACYDKLKDYKVRVECKNDGYANSVKKLALRVYEQLIKKYLENKSTRYGVYLVFYFGDSNKSIEELDNEIKQKVPKNWKDNIEVVIIDLKKV